MEAEALNRLSKQIRSIKRMLAVFLLFLFINLAVLGFIAYKVITFTHDITTKVDNIQNSAAQSLDLKKQVCDNSSLSRLIGTSSDLCKK